MGGGTLHIVMGHEAVLFTAYALGYKDAHNWSMRKCDMFCQELINRYMTELYPRLPTWFAETVEEAIGNQNRVTVYGNRTRLFFGNIGNDQGIQRELSAYYGQGGTAGKLNGTLLETFYGDGGSDSLDIGGGPGHSNNLALHLQVHDSIVGQVAASPTGLKLLDQFLTIMQKPVTILGRTFSIPVECEIGYSWGKGGLMGYRAGSDPLKVLADVRAHEDKLDAKYLERA